MSRVHHVQRGGAAHAGRAHGRPHFACSNSTGCPSASSPIDEQFSSPKTYASCGFLCRSYTCWCSSVSLVPKLGNWGDASHTRVACRRAARGAAHQFESHATGSRCGPIPRKKSCSQDPALNMPAMTPLLPLLKPQPPGKDNLGKIFRGNPRSEQALHENTEPPVPVLRGQGAHGRERRR